MNAVIALCHFCEVHGPCPIFCTYTLRDTKVTDLTSPPNDQENVCPGCNSIGHRSGMWSEDTESNANFLSTQVAVIGDIVPLIKQAAVRSLSCEVSGNHDGNLVFFGDATHGHVLSYTFQIHDSHARGFFRLFSIVVLMKDKMYLLNLQPFLAEHLKHISTELQTYSSAIHSAEHAKYSERALRLNSGQTSMRPPRSLVQLTGEPNVFALIHSHFTWILWMGARYLTENITMVAAEFNRDKPYSVIELSNGAASVQPAKRFVHAADMETGTSIRKCKQMLGEHFIAAGFCAVAGIQVALRGSTAKTGDCVKCLGAFLPDAMHRLVAAEAIEYLAPDKCRILAVHNECALPQATETLMVVDFCDASDSVDVRWPAQMPSRLPDLLNRVIKAINEPLFTDQVLLQHIRVLVEEWKNKILCLRTITAAQEMPKVKKVLGIQLHDQCLLDYWIDSLTD